MHNGVCGSIGHGYAMHTYAHITRAALQAVPTRTYPIWQAVWSCPVPRALALFGRRCGQVPSRVRLPYLAGGVVMSRPACACLIWQAVWSCPLPRALALFGRRCGHAQTRPACPPTPSFAGGEVLPGLDREGSEGNVSQGSTAQAATRGHPRLLTGWSAAAATPTRATRAAPTAWCRIWSRIWRAARSAARRRSRRPIWSGSGTRVDEGGCGREGGSGREEDGGDEDGGGGGACGRAGSEL